MHAPCCQSWRRAPTNASAPQLAESLPPPERLSRFSGVILFGDFLDPVEAIAERFNVLAGHGVSGHVVQILDPAEETLPYAGRTEFIGLEGSDRWTAAGVKIPPAGPAPRRRIRNGPEPSSQV